MHFKHTHAVTLLALAASTSAGAVPAKDTSAVATETASVCTHPDCPWAKAHEKTASSWETPVPVNSATPEPVPVEILYAGDEGGSKITHEKPDHEKPSHEKRDDEKSDHEKPGHEKADHEKPTHEKPTHEKPTHEKLSHEKPSHEKPSHEEPDHEEPDHEEPDHEKPSHEKPSHEKPSVSKSAGPKPTSLTKAPKPTSSKPLTHSTIPVFVPGGSDVGAHSTSASASASATPSKDHGKGNDDGAYPTATGVEFKSSGGKVSASGLGAVVGGVVGLFGFFY